jgi:hypothetical protein
VRGYDRRGSALAEDGNRPVMVEETGKLSVGKLTVWHTERIQLCVRVSEFQPAPALHGTLYPPPPRVSPTRAFAYLQVHLIEISCVLAMKVGDDSVPVKIGPTGINSSVPK